MRILLVQDHVGILSYHTDILRQAGHTVRPTRNGDEAIELFSRTKYDLVLTDLWHPGLEGHNLIKRIFKISPKQLVGVISTNPKMEEEIDVPRLDSFDASDLLTFVGGLAALRTIGPRQLRRRASAQPDKTHFVNNPG